MLNPELQKDIDVEIEKGDQITKEFLCGSYFRETMNLIFRVNKLNEVQMEGVELETILFLLKISDALDISDAIKNNCNIVNPNTVQQVVEDLKKYILEKFDATKVLYSQAEERSLPVLSAEDENSAPQKELDGHKNLLKEEEIMHTHPRDIIKGTEPRNGTANEKEVNVNPAPSPTTENYSQSSVSRVDLYRESIEE